MTSSKPTVVLPSRNADARAAIAMPIAARGLAPKRIFAPGPSPPGLVASTSRAT
ncbi:MAG: hypothetical protein LIP23_06330 [Planctomycetes bacterium]|nr:hypothetical protein [Planctomycetota bacterium]